jgi:hypothetical protein
MEKVTEEQLRLISRITRTQDGKDFLNEILTPMVNKNYNQLLGSGKEVRDELIGYGNCLKELVDIFENCDIRLNNITKTSTENWS